MKTLESYLEVGLYLVNFLCDSLRRKKHACMVNDQSKFRPDKSKKTIYTDGRAVSRYPLVKQTLVIPKFCNCKRCDYSSKLF